MKNQQTQHQTQNQRTSQTTPASGTYGLKQPEKLIQVPRPWLGAVLAYCCTAMLLFCTWGLYFILNCMGD